jgi:serine/threonine-protein kinase
MPGKAIAVYEHILKAGRFKDVAERADRLRVAESVSTFVGPGSAARAGTVVLTEGAEKPTFGRYEIVTELGRGAMGTVYLGRDPKINREVAIKTLSYDDVEPGELPEVKERFFREAAAVGKLSHPNIMTIYDVGEDHDMAYLAIELLSGQDLSLYSKPDDLLPLHEVLRIVADVARALDYAHNNGVVHRDIKPANIMLLNDGTVKVTDFGVARVADSSKTSTGIVLGTPGYMSPEQVSGEKVSGQSDLFSLGVVMYELLTGTKPFQGESIAAIMYNISKGAFTSLSDVDPGLPKCTVEIVKKLMAKALSRRYKNGEAVALDAAECLETLGGE